ncbi:MAG TPA: LuxR C-terminal-related transcriptional regulator [Micromonosporaceae bacterium]|nr:LuxR C-terminal-related transcriptional regulator [Micromonosporaceae bacterium]
MRELRALTPVDAAAVDSAPVDAPPVDPAAVDTAPVDAPAHRPLLAAKMTPPEPGDVVARPRLFTRLDEAAARPVTLLVAPAGWGKTVLLTSWLRSQDGGRGSAWLTVEARDRLEDLWSYVEAALPTSSRTEHPVPPPDDHESLVHLAAAIADLPARVTLVVDAAEQIGEPDFVSGLDYLVGHAAGKLRLILAARSAHALPAHRWRLHGAVTELTAQHLAFTTAEVIELFAAHGRTLSADQAHEVRDRAEGWPAGLRLAALALAEHPEPARFVAEFGGDLPAITGYLVDEVLSGLSPHAVETFTLCAIEEQLCDGLVDAVTGGGDGAALLADAAREIGFTVAVDDRAGTYRHHRMLADVFRARLSRRPEVAVQDLQRRAARWFADNDQPARALRHALAGRDWSLAEALLRHRWRDLLPPAEVAGPAPPAPTPEQLRSRPMLALGYAADRLAARDPRASDSYLRLVGADEHLLTAPPQAAVIAAALRLGRAQLAGSDAQVRATANGLLALAQPDRSAEPIDRGARGIARIAAGGALLSAGQLALAEEALAGGVSDADEARLSRVVWAGRSRLAVVQALRGRLGTAADSAHRALGRADPDAPADRAPAYLALALVSVERDRPDEVAAHLVPAALSTDPFVSGLATLTEAKLRSDGGDLAGAYQLIQAGRRSVDSADGSPYLATSFAAADAELRVARGDHNTGRADLYRLVESGAEPAGVLAVALARVHLRAQDPHAVAQVLAGWAEREDDSWPLPVRLAAGVLDAEAARQLTDHRRAARLLEQVLALADPDGFRRVFTRADPPARELLAAHLDSGTAHWPLVNELLAVASGTGHSAASRPAPPGEPLTERELTILRYLQSVLSNVEIARELSVSVNTVKTHVRSIYRKLNATRRREAVRRAREWHLL